MSNPQSISLADKIDTVPPLRFLRADLMEDGSRAFTTVHYALNDEVQPLGLRLDLSKRAFLDTTGNAEADSQLVHAAPKVADIVLFRSRLRVRPTPRRFNLGERFEIEGLFWLPGDDVITSQGTLTYIPDDRVRLVLANPLSSQTHGRNPFEMGTYPIILAKFTDGAVASLVDCFVTNQSFGAGGAGRSKLLVNKCVFGVHFVNVELLRFTGMQIRFKFLEQWLSGPLVAVEYEHDKSGRFSGVLMRYTRPEPKRFSVASGGLQVTIHSGYALEQGFADLHFKQTATIQIQAAGERSIEDWLGIGWSLQILFSLFFGESAVVVEESLEISADDSHDDIVECPFVAIQRVRKPSSELHGAEMTVTYSEVASDLDKVLDTWMELVQSSRRSLAAFFETLCVPDIPLELRFISVVSALEMYGTSTAPDGQPSEKLSETLFRLSDSLPPELTESILGSKSKMIDLVASMRNVILHGKSHDGVVSLEGKALHVATDRLRSFYIALLLQRIGVPINEIRQRLNRKNWIRWALEQNG